MTATGRSMRCGAAGQFARLACLFALLGVSALGCGAEGRTEPETIALDPHAAGNNQYAMHGEELGKPLRVVVSGPRVPGLLGGKGSRKPVRDEAVTFRIEAPGAGALFVESGTATHIARTNESGIALARLKLGRRSGDVDVTASVETRKGVKSVSFRALSGVEILGADLEGPTGGVIDGIGVRLHDASGAPAEGVTVFFRVEGDGRGSKVAEDVVETDKKGCAVTDWKLGNEVGRYFAFAEIRDTRSAVPENGRFHARTIEFEAMGMNKGRMAVELVGGLAIFILGMKMMSGGLRRMADRRLKAILQAMTRNRVLAVLVGAGLTAMVQSSSATTVMTVGFVNAGLMNLGQAIGVVFGANIGTTVTAQIIAFKLNALAYPAIAVGLITTAVSRKPNVKALGETILGFGLLFLGMQTMSGILKPLQYSPGFVAVFSRFDCTPAPGGLIPPIPALMCILVATAATVFIQSSSATVGLVLALSSQGLVTFYTAVPLILGDNIGTTITAILASVPANRNAKRAALAHTLFNVFGALYMYILLFVPLWNGQPVFLGFVDAITPGDVFGPNAEESVLRHVANAHTAFNVMNCLFFLPFIGAMTKVCQRIIPMTALDRETVLQYLEPHLLDSPTLALQQATLEVGYMVRRAQKSVNDACAFFHGGPSELAEKVEQREQVIDRLQHEITAYLVDLSRRGLPQAEGILLPALIHAVNDAERIGDHSEDIVELARIQRADNHELSEFAQQDVRGIEGLLEEQFEAILNILEKSNTAQVETVLKKESAINEAVKVATEAHVERLEQGKCSVQAGVVFLDILAHLERVGDRLTNIAERAGTIIQATAG
ncbi:MAG TPA: Na/Pi symporter [Candidatus Hydrogenedentes bacterium]|nr:Na/Pi symporter [Candidatus Hydrogenedentota bacterium]HIJ72634.1 Na/Pi symporter [Candidatus Hydrogenedentota bacterium]